MTTIAETVKAFCDLNKKGSTLAIQEFIEGSTECTKVCHEESYNTVYTFSDGSKIRFYRLLVNYWSPNFYVAILDENYPTKEVQTC